MLFAEIQEFSIVLYVLVVDNDKELWGEGGVLNDIHRFEDELDSEAGQ